VVDNEVQGKADAAAIIAHLTQKMEPS
jgi:hypothetical protein